ncbi:MAG TPA: anthranilate synthase component I family protein [Phycisphaerae bacterium]|nr:anthranilate synthase component I family protein [Phycisphaerae bacterium]
MSPAHTIFGRPGVVGQTAVRDVAWPQSVEAVFEHLARRRGCVWLDSAGGPRRLARWSVLAAEPSAVLVHQGGTAWLMAPDGRRLFEVRGQPFAALRRALRAFPAAGDEQSARLPFGPGLYGYLAYDLGQYVEPTAGLAPRRDIPLPDLWFGLYEAVLVLDHHESRAYLVGAEGPAYEAINAALHASSEVPLSSRSLGPPPARQTPAAPPLTCNLSREAYLRVVERAREYIAAGDIFQVNLSRRFTVALDPGTRARAVTFSRPACGARPSEAGPDLPLADLYLGLRQMNPAPYAAFLGLGAGRAVLSTSPELFLDSRGGRIVTRPIKGTRPRRPGDETFNERMRQDLLASEKDRAELVMIVDLERNDLGRVSAYGTVRVTEPRTVEAYAAVYHTVATVEGRLQPGRDVVDLLKATFPGGSITGAPKVRAMQIIAELEPTRRSVYTGAIGYLGPPSPSEPAGRAALNIAIRTVLATSSAVHLQVGGGVVADSEPEAEFDETTDKARAILAALGLTA